MHPAALQWAKLNIPEQPRRVLDIGGADINCSLRSLYTWSAYTCIDSHDGPGVDVVADAVRWMKEGHEVFDLIVCFEVFEHTDTWPEICVQAFEILEPGGLFVGTCASIGRSEHSAWGTPELQPGEHYRNVSASDLADAFDAAGFTKYTIDRARAGLDLRWKAVRT